MKKDFLKNNKQKGAAMLVSLIFFIFISLAVVAGLVSPSARAYNNANNLIQSHQSYFLSESVLEDSYYRLKNGLNIGSTNSLTLNGDTASANITDSGYNEKTITTIGDVNQRQRKNKMSLSTGSGISFSYGVQVGIGGITMANNSVIEGSVYANGPIVGSGSITGSATSANSASLTADQENGSGTPSQNITFGDSGSTQDFAQSFQISRNDVLNKVDLYVKKVGSPGNLTVRLVSDSSGNPSGSTITSGSLSSSLISSNYGWVSVPFSSNPELVVGTTYWIVVDGANNSSKYYVMAANNGVYTNGTAKIGKFGGNWSNTSPSTLDAYFKIYFGGITGLIDGITIGTTGVGDAYANTVTDSNIAGTNYCQTGTGNNKVCDTSLPDPTQIAMPISDQNILDWKSEAATGGTYSGNFTVDDSVASIGPKKIDGNMTITNGADLTITGLLWVTGNLVVSNNANVSLSPSFGSSEGAVIVDGTVTISNNAVFSGSGEPGSYIMVLSTSTSTSAISLANNGGAVILYAANGTVNLSNNAGAKALNGKYIHLNNNVVIVYESGLANSNFVNGPSGGWEIKSWEEVN